MTQTNITDRALLVVDVQTDFIEGGALAVTGGYALAERLERFIDKAERNGSYGRIIASKDWHKPLPCNNAGHFATDGAPDYQTSWPVHCVAGTKGAAFAEPITGIAWDAIVRKGHGCQSYSAFEGVTKDGTSLLAYLRTHGITEIDVVGIATDYCVKASVLDGLGLGFRVNVIFDLIAGVAPESSTAALELVADKGANLIPSVW